MSWCVDQLAHQLAPRFDAWTRRRAMRGDMTIPAIGRRVRHGERFSAIFERLDMVSFEATGFAANYATPAVALENGFSECGPPALTQFRVMTAPRMLSTHPTIADRSRRGACVFFALR